MSYRITVTPQTSVVQRTFNNYAKSLRTWRSLWRQIAMDLAKAEAELFKSEGAVGGVGGKWAPLAESTAARKEAGLPILVETGKLRKLMTSSTAMAHYSASDVFVYGPPDYYVGEWNLAALHQAGTSKMPARPPMISITLQRLIARRRLQEHVRRSLRKR